MSCLVMGYGLLLLRSDDLALLLQTADYPVNCIEEILSVNRLLVTSCSCESSLVADIGYIGSREARSVFCKEFKVEIIGKFQSFEMHGENLLPLLEIRKIDVDLPVKTAGTHKRLVKDISPVGSGQDDYT